MLPTDKPDTTEFSVEATMQAAREVGGDFYDFFPVGPREYAFCVADVSDKGVASALFMSVTKALIKARCREDNSTASVVTWVNDEIAIGNDSCMFITLFIALLDAETGQVRYTNAGHNPPYIKRADGSLECIAARHGPMVGAMGGIVYGEDTLQLARDDTLVLFTDGVTEAMNGARELYGEGRLEALLAEYPQKGVESLVQDVLASVREFADGAEQSDDITLLAFSYDADPSGAGTERLEIRLANDISAIGDVVNRFEQFGEMHGVPAGDIMRVNLVFDEILSNIISYGYQDEEHHEIVVTVELTGRRLVVTIEDDGIPFNPFAREAPDTNAAIEDREIGGLGIHLVQQVMDSAIYQRRQNANVVIFSKAFEEAPGASS
jgi:sigma-B regulation protein RsbU (phosphoserine phosphatase)